MHLLLDEHFTKENGHSSMHLEAGSNKYVPSSFFLHCDKEVLRSRTGRANQQCNQFPCLVSQTYNTAKNSNKWKQRCPRKVENSSLYALYSNS